jgi:hypothetical protein
VIRFGTIDLFPPAAVSYFTPEQAFSNTEWSDSVTDVQIRSAFDEAQKEVRRYQKYRDRWDGYDAQPFPPEVLGSVAAVLELSQNAFLAASTLPTMVTTGPASDGSIDVEFRVGDRRIIMTLYAGEDHIRLLSFDAGKADEHSEPLRNRTLAKWLGWLHGTPGVSDRVGADQVHPR